MNSKASSFSPVEETRPLRVIRAVTWVGILAGALCFWLIAGWMAWDYLLP